MTSGEQDLHTLLNLMKPELREEVYVFCTLPPGQPAPLGLDLIMDFREKEGRTLIVAREQAEAAKLQWVFPSRMITLSIHSALDAVGFLAAIATHLAKAGISTNAVSAFYHDHLFVPEDKAGQAMDLLKNLSISS